MASIFLLGANLQILEKNMKLLKEIVASSLSVRGFIVASIFLLEANSKILTKKMKILEEIVASSLSRWGFMVASSFSGWGFIIWLSIGFSFVFWTFLMVVSHQIKTAEKANSKKLSYWDCFTKTDLGILDLWATKAWFFLYIFVFRIRHPLGPLPSDADDFTYNLEMLIICFWVLSGYFGFRSFRYWWYRIDAADVELNQPSVFKRESFWRSPMFA